MGSSCPCLSQSAAGALLLGIDSLVTANGKYSAFGTDTTYPESYGVGCARHDINLEPDCTQMICSEMGNGMAYRNWCVERWCWVDELNCSKAHARSKYVPDRNISYSYEACGDTAAYVATTYEAFHEQRTSPSSWSSLSIAVPIIPVAVLLLFLMACLLRRERRNKQVHRMRSKHKDACSKSWKALQAQRYRDANPLLGPTAEQPKLREAKSKVMRGPTRLGNGTKRESDQRVGFYLLDADFVRHRYLEWTRRDLEVEEEEDEDDQESLAASFKRSSAQGIGKMAVGGAQKAADGAQRVAASAVHHAAQALRRKSARSTKGHGPSSQLSAQDLPEVQELPEPLEPLPPWQTLRTILADDGLPVVRYFEMSKKALMRQLYTGSVLAISQ